MALNGSGVSYAIASLPKPFDAKNGRIQAAVVHGLRGSRKRKRHEVAVGIDGEAVSIYNIQTQNIVSSHAIPPQSFLTCPPTSLYCRKPKHGKSQRHTYVVLKDSIPGAKQKLSCFSEYVDQTKGLIDNTKQSRKELALKDAEILALDILPFETADGYDEIAGVLVLYKDGTVDCVSPSLAKLYWHSEAEKPSSIEYAKVFDGDSARRGIFAGREDVVAALGIDTTTTSRQVVPQLLCQIYQVEQSIELRAYKIRVPSIDEAQSQRPGLQLVMEYRLPSTVNKMLAGASHNLNAASGKLYRLDSGRLTIFDLSNTTPRLLTHFGNQKSPISSFARLSSNLVVAVTGDQAVIYETRYGSVQDSARLTADLFGKKRKHASDGSSAPAFEALYGFGELNLVVGFSGRDLTAIQFAESDRPSKRGRSQTTALASVVGKGIAAEALRLAVDDELSVPFKEWKNELDTAIQLPDTRQLELLAADVLQYKRRSQLKQNNDSTAGDSIDDVELTAQSFDIQSVDRRRALYLLAKCFRLQGDMDVAGKQPKLVPAVRSAAVYKWLALTGFLAPDYINQALVGQEVVNVVAPLVLPGDIMASIRLFDHDLELVHGMLALSVPWDVEEVVQVLKIIAQSFEVDDQPVIENMPRLLAEDGVEDTAMAVDDIESAIEQESRAAEQEVSQAESTLSRGLEIRSAALQLTLARLHAFPAKVVTSAMRARMTQQEIIFFINLLRIELAEGGWTSRYADARSDPGAEEIDWERPASAGDRAIGAIADMLNCAVDAIGINGWLVGLSGDVAATEELINSLRAEISTALEGCYEAKSIEMFLNELERHHALASPQALEEAKNGGLEKAALPLGGRTEAPVVKGRESKSASRKSNNMIHREKLLRIGKYSLDRIRF